MRNIKRVLSLAMALVMVIGMMVTGASAATYDFNDGAEIEYVEAVEVLTGLGVLEGDDNGDFNAKDILTREQAAKIMAYIMLGEKNAEKLVAHGQVFTDVATDRWSAGFISYCANVGLIAGRGDGTFDPTGELTGVAFAKLLLCAAGYDASVEGYVGGQWAANITADAVVAGLDIAGVALAEPVTREQAAQMVLQALETKTVEYITGNVVGLIGPFDVVDENDEAVLFMNKFYADLEKDTVDSYTDWGYPVDYQWKYYDEPISVVMYEKVAEYTVAVSECDIAEELGIKKEATIDRATWNDKVVESSSYNKINATVQTKFGGQGTLTEIYAVAGGKYAIVMKDEFVATVTDVTEVEYDRNGHIEEPAELYLDICLVGDYEYPEKKESDKDWSFEKGDTLLVYYSETDYTSEIIGYADSMVGAQTAFTKNANVHIIEDAEYDDAIQFNHDETGARDTNDYTWYFDSYGNLIAAKSIAPAASNYAVLSSIYWKDSNNGDNGYAIATLTYVDGSSETVTVYSIDEAVLEGVEGKGADYEDGYVSSTKQYNKAEFTNKALYKLVNDRYGLNLVAVDALADDTTIETGVPAINDELNAGKSTQFLVWNGKTYETYTGIRNVPTYDGTVDGYYVDVRNDKVADIIFLINPVDPVSVATNTVLYYFDGRLTEKTYLKSGEVSYYTLTGGLVNGEEETIAFAAAAETLMDEVQAEKGVLMVLTIEDDFVVAMKPVNDVATSVKINGKTYYAVYAGAVDNDTKDTADDAEIVDDVLMTVYGDAYDVEDLENVITYKYDLTKTLKKDDAAYMYIVYTQGSTGYKIADTIYITDVKSKVIAPEDPAEIIAAAYALGNKEYLPYAATLTGEIISIDTEYSTQYKNITVTIVVGDDAEHPIMCFRLKGEGAATLAVGDVITVTGNLMNYNGTIEFDAGCTLG